MYLWRACQVANTHMHTRRKKDPDQLAQEAVSYAQLSGTCIWWPTITGKKKNFRKDINLQFGAKTEKKKETKDVSNRRRRQKTADDNQTRMIQTFWQITAAAFCHNSTLGLGFFASTAYLKLAKVRFILYGNVKLFLRIFHKEWFT